MTEKPQKKLRDAIRLLDTILMACEGAEVHSWRKCKRCAAMHGLEMRMGLSMRLVQTARDACIAAADSPCEIQSVGEP